MIFKCSTFVEVDGVKNRLFDDGATPLPIWEPHYCLLLQGEKRLSHHRTEKVFVETNLKIRNYWKGGGCSSVIIESIQKSCTKGHICSVQF